MRKIRGIEHGEDRGIEHGKDMGDLTLGIYVKFNMGKIRGIEHNNNIPYNSAYP
jgi:hypothetical protein